MTACSRFQIQSVEQLYNIYTISTDNVLARFLCISRVSSFSGVWVRESARPEAEYKAQGAEYGVKEQYRRGVASLSPIQLRSLGIPCQLPQWGPEHSLSRLGILCHLRPKMGFS